MHTRVQTLDTLIKESGALPAELVAYFVSHSITQARNYYITEILEMQHFF